MSRSTYSTFKAPVSRAKRDTYLEDGVDHINVGVGACTKLGQMLSRDAAIPIKHPVFGHFKTHMGFWFYISCGTDRDDRYRRFVGKQLHDLYHKNNKRSSHITNFKAIVLEAVYYKIIQNQELFQEVFDNVLEIDCYKTLRSGIRQELSYSRWWVAGLRKIFYCIQTGKTPDFTHFMDTKGIDMYEHVLPEYLKRAISAQEHEQEIQALERIIEEDKAAHPDIQTLEEIQVPSEEIYDDVPAPTGVFVEEPEPT